MSPRARPGLVPGRPDPALVTRASGRRSESASRWILLVSPPPAGPAPPGPCNSAQRLMRGRGAQHRRRQPRRADVGLRRPGRPPHRSQRAAGPGPSPGSRPRPAAMPVIDGLPVPEPLRRVPPQTSGPDPVEHPVDHHAVIIPPVPLPRVSRQQRLQPRPLRVTKIMPLQPLILHDPIQPKSPTEIYRTRPHASARRRRGASCCHAKVPPLSPPSGDAFPGAPFVTCRVSAHA